MTKADDVLPEMWGKKKIPPMEESLERWLYYMDITCNNKIRKSLTYIWTSSAQSYTLCAFNYAPIDDAHAILWESDWKWKLLFSRGFLESKEFSHRGSASATNAELTAAQHESICVSLNFKSHNGARRSTKWNTTRVSHECCPGHGGWCARSAQQTLDRCC